MPRRIIIAAAVVALAGCAGAMRGAPADPPVVREDDLRQLSGAQWKGTLRSRDLQTNLITTVPAHVTVTQSSDDPLAWIFSYEYPREPRASRRHTVVLSADGRSIDDAKVVERRTLADGTLRVVTWKASREGDRYLAYRNVYLIGGSRASIRKEVIYDRSAEYVERNTFTGAR
ncbi:MAG TPA: hypothetical protein VFR81_16195 [Longimicrobium sp.]|nr:hypothetical protein [Longimicrobium sp.]